MTILAAAWTLSCAVPSRLEEIQGSKPPEAGASGEGVQGMVPAQKAWAHSIVRVFSPPWQAGAADPMRESVFPILKDGGSVSLVRVELYLEYFAWKAAGGLLTLVEVEPYPQAVDSPRKSVSAVLAGTPPRKVAGITARWAAGVEVELPFAADALTVRVTRPIAGDTFSHDPAVTHLRLAY